MKQSLQLEICADSIDSALAAERGGAHRIELCSSLLEGGLTPSAGFIRRVRDRVSIGLWVMIRPRGGDFCYSEDEYIAMKEDILVARRFGANGVALGLLAEEGCVDVDRTRELVGLARPLEVTFHRAFDVSASLEKSLEDVVGAGADRILTSGGAQTALEGLEPIKSLVQAAQGRIVVMAGSGVNSQNAARLIAATGVTEVHASAKTRVESRMSYRKSISMGQVEAEFGEYSRFVANHQEVSALARVLGQFG